MYVTNKAGHFFADIIIRSKTKKKTINRNKEMM